MAKKKKVMKKTKVPARAKNIKKKVVKKGTILMFFFHSAFEKPTEKVLNYVLNRTILFLFKP